MKFKYRLFEEDYMKHALYNLKSSNGEKEMLVQMRLWAVMVMIPMIMFTLEVFLMSNIILDLLCSTTWVCIVLAVIFRYPVLARKRIEKQAMKSAAETVENSPVKEESELEMNEKGIACFNNVSDFFYKWACVQKVCFNSKYVYLITNNSTFIIPVYKTEHSVHQVLDYMKTFVSDEKVYAKMEEY